MKKKTVIISQARLGSTRLPRKVLLKVKGKTLLEHHVIRLRQAKMADDVCVATTINSEDDAIVALCEQLGVTCVRGSEEDVLARFALAADFTCATNVVRVTSDCPLIDPNIIDITIRILQEPGATFDYVSNTLTRSFPRGMDCEAFTTDALYIANREAQRQEEREHVTPYIYWNRDKFSIKELISKTDYSQHRWTVDTEKDAKLISLLLDAGLQISSSFRLDDLLRIIERHPEWEEINKDVQQKLIYK